MTGAQPYRRSLAASAVALAFVGVAGCALDREADVRVRLDGWVSIGDTVHFKSAIDCTAGEFVLRQPRIKSKVAVVDTVDEGLRLLQQGWAVGFDVPGQSPSEVSETISFRNLPEGIGVLASGVSAKECMSDEMRSRYLAALTTTDAVLVFDTTDNALAVVDHGARLVFFMRGSV